MTDGVASNHLGSQTSAKGKGARTHVCPKCNLSFNRLAHLRRHSTTHTGHDIYLCPCGQSFVRRDGIARHVKSCASAEEQATHSGTTVPKVYKPTRSKKACDSCAQAKLRCDAQTPCARCRGKSMPCTYSREGYRDPYEEFRWDPARASTLGNNVSLQHETSMGDDHGVYDMLDSDALMPEDSHAEPVVTQSDSAVADTALLRDTTHTTSGIFETNNPNIPNSLNLEEANATQLGYRFDYSIDDAAFQWDECIESVFFNAFGQFDPPMPDVVDNIAPEGPPRDAQQTFSEPDPLPSPQAGGFSLLQMDPVEAKCAEIRSLLQSSYFFRNDQSLLQHITRDKILKCHQLYGLHIQPNLPLLHSVTYQFAQTAPMLSLAIMVVGACYSPELLRSDELSRFATRLSMMMGTQCCEPYPDRPSFAIVQASVILTTLLTSSRNPNVAQQVQIQLAQSLAIAERARILDHDGYQFSADNFNWAEWIRNEARNRLACQILCQEMAGCIFLGRPSSLLPWAFHVPLPSYEECWNARTADECRASIERMPKPALVSTAVKEICNPDGPLPKIETSAYGMFTLILALIGLAFRKAQATLEPSDDSDASPFSSSPSASVNRDRLLRYLDILDKDCSGATVAMLAEKAVNAYGSTGVRRANEALDRWCLIWEQRKIRETAVEGSSFSTDPLPFWFLAKLYLLACLIRPPADNAFSLLMTHARMSVEEKVRAQEKIVSWLNGFRVVQVNVPSTTGMSSIASDGSPAFEEENRLRHLMKPLK